VLNSPVKLVDPTGGSPVTSDQSIKVMKQGRASVYWALLDVPYVGVALAAAFDTLVGAFPTDQELVMDLIPGPATVSAPSKKIAKAVREGIYEFIDTTRKPYVGQSVDVPNRLKKHIRNGNLDPNATTSTTEVTGGKTAREVAEHRRIQELTGGEPARFSDKVSNKRDPVGPKRQHLLEED